MSDPHHEKALATRREYAARSQAMGITEAFVGLLVDTFYDRVRDDDALGPIFEARLADRWPEHIAKMKSFWRSIAFMSGEYHGRPMQTHADLSELEPWQFGIWLGLFHETANEIAPTPEAAAFFTARADKIAKSLMLGLFYKPEDAVEEATT